jgi:transposase
VFFHWETSRATACLDNLIPATFTGTIQCDGYAAYRAFANRRGQAIELAGCWAHVRRKFHEALESSPRLASWLLGQIQQLYRIEANLRAHHAGPRLRAAVRASESRPVVQRLERALLKLKASKRQLPQSLLGTAIDYALGQWRTLEIYLADGRVEIDNNLVENAVRPTAIGKKNWLFVGEADAGQRSAIIYTVIETCRRHGLNPYQYLRDVLNRLPNMTNHQIPQVIPAAWGKIQRTLQPTALPSEIFVSDVSCPLIAMSSGAPGDAYGAANFEEESFQRRDHSRSRTTDELRRAMARGDGLRARLPSGGA